MTLRSANPLQTGLKDAPDHQGESDKPGCLFASGGHEARERRAAEWKSVRRMCGRERLLPRTCEEPLQIS